MEHPRLKLTFYRKFASLLLAAFVFSQSFHVHADYASDYRALWEKWKKADEAFKKYTKDLKPGAADEALKKNAEEIGYQFHTAKRTHPDLTAENESIEKLKEALVEAAIAKDAEAKKEIQGKINEAYASLARSAKKIPDLVKLEAQWIEAMEAQRASTWSHKPKAKKLYIEVESLRRQLAELRASQK